MIELTKQQVAAIEHPGNLVITACPGSGKTTVISEKIRNELVALKRHQGVIAITFTRKASKELARRCTRGGVETKSSFFGTIDAFCLSEIILPFSKFIFGAGPGNVEPKFTSELSEAENSIISDAVDLHGELSGDNVYDYMPVIEELYKLGCVYFPSIPFLATHIVKESKACRNYLRARYSTAYIDEYQDSSSAQHNLFLSLLEVGIRGVCVGDIQQSIYGWRKSSPEFLKQLISMSVFKHLTVSVNHRCHPSISNYANRLFDQFSDIEQSDDVRVYYCEMEGTELDAAVKLNNIIPSIIKKFPVKNLSDVAVLVRYNKGLERLREKITIPCKIYTEDSLSKIESKTSQLWVALLEFKFDKSVLVGDLIDTYSPVGDLRRDRLKALRDAIKKVRTVSLDDLAYALMGASKLILDIPFTAFEVNALIEIVNDPDLLNQYLPATEDQIQCMTLHKSKGLEFDIVIHLDLVEWVFPKRVPGASYSERVYPELEQDLNLHYVGITRAKKLCVLLHTTQRINAQNAVKQAEPSTFLSLAGLDNLYKIVKRK